jgi:hypothetical protein
VTAESLSDRVSRAKARWLKRVMQDSLATSTEKCLAYAIADCLNCVTLDCWPAQQTLARMLGHKSIKTVQRAGRALARRQLITLKRDKSRKAGLRYAPVFWLEDMNNPVPRSGHLSPRAGDTDGRESLLGIHIKSSSTEEAAGVRSSDRRRAFNPRKRGAVEVKLAEMLGANGWEVLARLASIDDAIVECLCQAYSAGALSKRDLAAARLAAVQAGRGTDHQSPSTPDQ